MKRFLLILGAIFIILGIVGISYKDVLQDALTKTEDVMVDVKDKTEEVVSDITEITKKDTTDVMFDTTNVNINEIINQFRHEEFEN